jgi:hypothetical protein
MKKDQKPMPSMFTGIKERLLLTVFPNKKEPFMKSMRKNS